MKQIHIITLFLLLGLLFSCGGGNNSLYPDNGTSGIIDDESTDNNDMIDEDNTIINSDVDNGPGGLGSPCSSQQDCLLQYKCSNGVCVNDTPPQPDKDEREDGESVDETTDSDNERTDTATDEDETTDTLIDDTTSDIDEQNDEDSASSVCGNGIVESSELCDDGNVIDNDYCSNDCQTDNGACGDNIKQSFERCDDGNTLDGDYCSSDCTAITGGCGDGTLQTGELCDDGDNNGRYGYCSLTCDGLGISCGDGVLQGIHERCDDGNNDNGDYCSADCQTVIGICGDGTVQTNELCDDGNRKNGDYCSANCQTENGACGDGIKQDFEECDDGNTVTDSCPYGEISGCTVCSAICRFATGNITYCGDGVVDTENGELCDDGNENGTYGQCGDDCTAYSSHCGDSIIDFGELCDDGESNGIYGYCSGLCDGDSYCGDGAVDPKHENCDDGNNMAGDYCSGDCQTILGYCGDGSKQSNEECDDNNKINDDYCTNLCKINGNCGDGITQSNEICDDGLFNGSYGKCNDTCDGMGPHCGDGFLDSGYETCEIGQSQMCSFYGSQYMDGYATCDTICSGFDKSSCDIFSPSALPGTNISNCYNNSETISCASPNDDEWYGQDGDFTHTPLLSAKKETLNGDSVVRTKTKNIWWQGTVQTKTYTANEATEYCKTLSYAGKDDWTLPDIEWYSNLLVDYVAEPHIIPQLAAISEPTTYWAANGHNKKQWIYNLADATTSLVDATTKHRVRCIRKDPKENFYDDIHIATTNAARQTYYTESFSQTAWTPQNSALTWKDAMAYCITLSYAGSTAWRLPTQPELLILSNKTHYNPASLFPTVASTRYWSATTAIETPEKVFVVDMLDGSSKTSDKTENNTFFCVRSTN